VLCHAWHVSQCWSREVAASGPVTQAQRLKWICPPLPTLLFTALPRSVCVRVDTTPFSEPVILHPKVRFNSVKVRGCSTPGLSFWPWISHPHMWWCTGILISSSKIMDYWLKTSQLSSTSKTVTNCKTVHFIKSTSFISIVDFRSKSHPARAPKHTTKTGTKLISTGTKSVPLRFLSIGTVRNPHPKIFRNKK